MEMGTEGGGGGGARSLIFTNICSDRFARTRDITTPFTPPGQASLFQRDYIGSADIIGLCPDFLAVCIFIVVVDGVVGRNETTGEDLIEDKTVEKCSGGTPQTFRWYMKKKRSLSHMENN